LNTRPAEPEFLVKWREIKRSMPPKVCHTCDHYTREGHCLAFDMRPPDDFAATPDACDQWIEELPF